MTSLIFRNLLKHPIRSLLTIGSLTIAVFLLCFLRTVVTTLEAGVEAADSRRLWVQSAVSPRRIRAATRGARSRPFMVAP